jgi:uncharacterized protein YecE (DUF72 family)
MGATIRIGISGWRYPPWRRVFYPSELPQRAELAYASRRVATIEINGSFYSLQRPESYQAWHDATPDAFVFAVKGGRYVTHLKRLRDVEAPLANFFASGVLRLGAKLGPFLWQLPPNFHYDAARLEAFLQLLPRTTADAAALAARHDRWMQDRVALEAPAPQSLRHALEVRHASFCTPAFIDLLRRHQVALVVADTAGKWPFLDDVTADFVYVRLHGDEVLYASGYSETALAEWARKIRAWARGTQASGVRTLAAPAPRAAGGRDVYVYFDNDVKVRAPFDAMSLAHRLNLGPPPEADPPDPAAIAEEPRTVWPAWKQPVAARATKRRPRNLRRTRVVR